jgi:hypothetical protein
MTFASGPALGGHRRSCDGARPPSSGETLAAVRRHVAALDAAGKVGERYALVALAETLARALDEGDVRSTAALARELRATLVDLGVGSAADVDAEFAQLAALLSTPVWP